MLVVAMKGFVSAGLGFVEEARELEVSGSFAQELMAAGLVRAVSVPETRVETAIAPTAQRAEQAVRHGRRHFRR